MKDFNLEHGKDLYARIFNTGQIGRFYMVSGSHARGRTFHLYILPEGVSINPKSPSLDEAVEVYGITGGHPGWSESYGWLHEGPWVGDFEKLVSKAIEENAARKAHYALELARKVDDEKKLIDKRLSTYKPNDN